jgi:NAD(P)-dependent dehydrogenase (short-subunit alcohol dehydrogenase family)
LAFAKEGAIVIVADVNDAGAEATVAAIRDAGGNAHSLHLDVCNSEAVAKCFATLDEMGLVADTIMNCAGGALAGDGPTHTVTDDAWLRTLDLNLKGTYLVCRNAIQRMLDKGTGGSIINLSARAALNGVGIHAYAAAKGGVAALSRSIGVTYAPKGIRCNALAPGPIDTALIASWMSDPAKRAQGLAGIPLGRVGKPDEIAALAVYLASDESAFMTAAVIPIDGGASSV